MKKLKLNNKGMTIVEVAISMTLLVIITVTAMTLIGNAFSSTTSSIKSFKSFNKIGDFVEIFQESTDKENFINIIEKIYNPEIDKETNGSYDISIDDIVYNVHLIQNTIIINAYSDKYKENKLHYYSYNKGE